MECHISDGSSRSSLSRKSLFPCEKIESDDSDVGHMSPLNSSTANSSDSEDPQSNDVQMIRNKLDDYIIYDNKYVDAKCSSIQAKSTPKMCRVPCTSETMSPLMLSPLQSLISSPILYSPNTDGIVPMSTTLELSPSEKMKTPHDTSIVLNKAPKLIRKSLIDTSQTSEHDLNDVLSDSITDSTLNKSSRLDSSLNKSKVRTALFTESDISDISLSVKSFYPKDNKYERSICESVVVNKKPKQKQAPTFICNRKRTAGLINAGVRHKIKKPRSKKLPHDKLLKAAMEIIKNSPLNEYFNKENRVNAAGNKVTEQVNKCVQDFNERKIRPLKEQTKVNQLNDQMEQERFVLVEEKGPRKRHIDADIEEQKRFFKSTQPCGVITVNKNIKIGVNNGQFELLEGPNTKRRKIDIIQGGFDDEIDYLENITSSNVNEILDTLESATISQNSDTDLSAAEKANILLSPTSQMCDMASGLAINSPKRAKLNINEILTSPSPNYNTTNTMQTNQMKVFPVFNNHGSGDKRSKNSTHSKKNEMNGKSKRFRATSPSQMLLDAGQKRFGVTQCGECQFVYHMGDPGEELMHNNHHNAGNILRFNGWKHEHVVSENADSRIVRVTIHDSKIWWKKIKDLMVVVNRDLGCFDLNVNIDRSVVYLFIRQRNIGGCIVAEPKQQAHRFLPALLDSASSGVDLCSEEAYPVRCGIVRMWTAPHQRRAGIATALMDALRTNFSYGAILRLEDIALSCPTDDGKKFAYRYFGTENFLIYS